MKNVTIGLAALLLLAFGSVQAFANYDPYLRFFVYVKKQKKCKEGALCADPSQAAPSVRVSNGSPYRYRCTGQLTVSVTDGEQTVAETVRVDKFIEPNAASFVIRHYGPGQQLSDLKTSGVDCTAI
ncbi:hypothetical protein [Vampirovibrio sp.]|uniref:hypothetical protein n=1 Tax=Vampirovibrio sp. TaxID=2717857 RepID=UPI003593089E